MAEITINHVVSGNVTVDGTINAVVSSGGGTAPKLQEKTATPTVAQQVITPDSDYDGLSKVTISGARIKNETLELTQPHDIINPPTGYLGFGSVAIDAKLQAKTVQPESYQQFIMADTGYAGLSSVTVAATSGGSDTLSTLMFTASNATATVDAASMGNKYFCGVKGCTSLVIKNASGITGSACKGWNTLKHVDIESPSIGISSFEDNPLETIILRGTTSIGKQAFYYASTTIHDIYIYTTSGVCTLGRNAFYSLASATVHVPASLLSAYQADSNWTAYTGITWAGDL